MYNVKKICQKFASIVLSKIKIKICLDGKKNSGQGQGPGGLVYIGDPTVRTVPLLIFFTGTYVGARSFPLLLSYGTYTCNASISTDTTSTSSGSMTVFSTSVECTTGMDKIPTEGSSIGY